MPNRANSQNLTQNIVQDLGVAVVSGKYTKRNIGKESGREEKDAR